MGKKETFDYARAVAELEEIAARVEDASTSIDDIDRYIKRTKELVEACRQYLRSNREALTVMEK
ncbi:MAG: exodeoxyribonuclease VII small subunit [Bacteroidales bacterium]|nr:exodeoxyribonuclease VII small subunit [Bacteroidales bacterium]